MRENGECLRSLLCETKGIPKKCNYNGDETKVLHEPVAYRQLAKKEQNVSMPEQVEGRRKETQSSLQLMG